MKRIENDCVECPSEIGCMGEACPYKNAVHYYCDDCNEETELYVFDELELCLDCIGKRLEKVSG